MQHYLAQPKSRVMDSFWKGTGPPSQNAVQDVGFAHGPHRRHPSYSHHVCRLTNICGNRRWRSAVLVLSLSPRPLGEVVERSVWPRQPEKSPRSSRTHVLLDLERETTAPLASPELGGVLFRHRSAEGRRTHRRIDIRESNSVPCKRAAMYV